MTEERIRGTTPKRFLINVENDNLQLKLIKTL
jgi:hypothetical protein